MNGSGEPYYDERRARRIARAIRTRTPGRRPDPQQYDSDVDFWNDVEAWKAAADAIQTADVEEEERDG